MKINPNKLRKHVLDMVYDKQSGHIGGSFSIAELTAYLYNNFNLIEGNDKIILSKGHAVPILYAALYELGVINTINNFREINSPLQGHPDKEKLPYMHATTGALGQGLSIAIGHALASKTKKLNNLTNDVFSDSEPSWSFDNNKIVIAYNLGNGKAVVHSPEANGDLTAGQSYFVQSDGSFKTSADSPSVTAGTALSTDKLLVKG